MIRLMRKFIRGIMGQKNSFVRKSLKLILVLAALTCALLMTMGYFTSDKTSSRDMLAKGKRDSQHLVGVEDPPSAVARKLRKEMGVNNCEPCRHAPCKPCQQCEPCSEPANEKEPMSSKQCTELLKTARNVTKSEYKIQLIAASPGSGNDWCMLTLKYLTGLSTGSVYHYSKRKNAHPLPTTVLYYHTHFPFLRHFGPVGEYLDTHPERVLILIRNPLDAGLSEYVRQTVAKQKNGTAKYSNAEGVFTEGHFLLRSKLRDGDSLKMAPALRSHLTDFFKNWKRFHNYWLGEYKGEITVSLYKDLLTDMTGFEKMAAFFGYDPHLTEERKVRLKCLYDNVAKTSYMKRRRVPAIDDSKEPVRSIFKSQIQEACSYVEKLYLERFNHTLTII